MVAITLNISPIVSEWYLLQKNDFNLIEGFDKLGRDY